MQHQTVLPSRRLTSSVKLRTSFQLYGHLIVRIRTFCESVELADVRNTSIQLHASRKK